jgi:hypothetical protein
LGVRGWFGFVPKKEVVHGAKNEVEFITATSFEVPFQESVFRQIQLKAGPGFSSKQAKSTAGRSS